MSAAKVPPSITILREAVWETSQSKADGAAYWRENAAARRALAVAYREAMRHAPDGTLLRAVLSDAASNLDGVARSFELAADETEQRERAASAGGQA